MGNGEWKMVDGSEEPDELAAKRHKTRRVGDGEWVMVDGSK